MYLKSKIKLPKKAMYIFLFTIILFHTINNYIIIKNNKAPLYHNSGGLLIENWKIYDELSNGKLNLHDYLSYSYLKFISILLYPYYKLFGISVNAILMTNIFFLSILVFSVYGIGSLVHSGKAGVLAAFIVSIFPHVFGLSRDYTVRFHLLAAVTLSIYFLLKTERFASLKHSIYFGLILGFSASTKPEFSIYLIGPFCIYLYHSVFKNYRIIKWKKIKTKIKNLAVSFFSFLLSLFIIGNINLSELKRSLFMSSLYRETVARFNPLFYLKSLIGIQILYYFAFIFFLSVIYFLFVKKKNKFLLFSWYFIPFLFFTFIVYGNLDIMFMLPSLPAVALMISIFLFNLKHRYLRLILVILTLLIGIIQFILVSYLINLYPCIETVNQKLGITDLNAKFFSYDMGYGSFPAQTKFVGFLHAYDSDWGIGDISNLIYNSLNNKSQHVNVAVYDSSLQHIIADPLNYILYYKNITNNEIIYAGDSPYYPFRHIEEEKLSEYLFGISYFYIITNKTYSRYEINAIISMIKNQHNYIGSTTLPNGIKVYVYKNDTKII